MVRITRLGRIINYMRAQDDVRLGLKIFQMLFFLVLYLHFMGCFLYLIVKSDEGWRPPTDYM